MTKLSDEFEARFTQLEQRNAALEQKNAVLEQRLARLEPTPAAPPPHVERGVTITHASPMAPSANLPTEQEAEALLDRVRVASPKLRDVLAVADERQQAQVLSQFRNSFAFVTAIYRRDKVNTDVDGLWWIQEAREFLRNAHLDNDVSWPALCAATIAAGDIPYTAMADYPYVYFALARGARGRYDPIFREILAGTREFMQPIEKVLRAS